MAKLLYKKRSPIMRYTNCATHSPSCARNRKLCPQEQQAVGIILTPKILPILQPSRQDSSPSSSSRLLFLRRFSYFPDRVAWLGLQLDGRPGPGAEWALVGTSSSEGDGRSRREHWQIAALHRRGSSDSVGREELQGLRLWDRLWCRTLGLVGDEDGWRCGLRGSRSLVLRRRGEDGRAGRQGDQLGLDRAHIWLLFLDRSCRPAGRL